MQENTTWKFYTHSEEVWQAMLTAINNATRSIDMEQFIFNNDEPGNRFLEALKSKAREGLKIRIFCDTVGSFTLSRSGIEKEFADLGIQIKFFNSVFPWHPNKESLWYFRDHRRLLIIDRHIGFTGGVCIGERMRLWRESHVQIEGLVVSQMLESFEVMWNRTFHKFTYYLKRKKIEGNNADFKYLTNAPLPGKRYMYRELIRAIKNAKHYIYLTTPYLLPDSRLLRNLKEASARGLEIRLIVPIKVDTVVVGIGGNTFFTDLLESGIRIFRYNGVFIHSKTAVIDGKWSTIGSLNLDNLSLRYNFEGNIVSVNKRFAFELEHQFLKDLELATELTLTEWRKRPLISKIAEILVWPIRKFL